MWDGAAFLFIFLLSSCRTLSPSLSFYSRSSRLAVVKHKQYPTVSDVPLLLFPPDSGSCKAHGNCLLSSQTPRFSNLSRNMLVERQREINFAKRIPRFANVV